MEWTKGYGLTTEWGVGNEVHQTNDGGYIAVGELSQVNDTGNVYVIKTDMNGSTGCNEVNLNFSSNSPSTISTIPTTALSSGITQNNIQTFINSGAIIGIYCSNVSVNEIENNKLQISISPNPFSSEAWIEVTGPSEGVLTDKLQVPSSKLEFRMYDVFGREVKSLQVKNQKFEIQRGNLPSGIYFYKVSAPIAIGGKVLGNGKVIIE